MNHGGYIKDNQYVGGKINYYDYVDKDRMSLVEVDSMVRGLNQNYGGMRINYWYKIGDNGLTKLETDLDAVRMCRCVPQDRLVTIYLDHLQLDPEYVELSDDDDELFMEDDFHEFAFSQAGSSAVVIEELPDSPKRQPSVVTNDVPDLPKKDTPKKQPKKAFGIVIREPEWHDVVPTQVSIALVHDPKDKGKNKVDEVIAATKFDDQQNLMDVPGYDEPRNSRSRSLLPNDYEEGLWFENSSEDEDYAPEFDKDDYNDYGVDDDWLGGMEIEFNETGKWIGGGGQGSKGGLDGHGSSASMDHDKDMLFKDNEQLYGAIDSDEECIGYEVNSDGEEEGDGYPEFNPKTDMFNPQFCNGMKFATAKILRAAVRERAIQKGWEPSFYKTDSWRVDVICKAQNCPFELYASKMQHESTLQIKRYNGKHTCARVNVNSSVRVPYLIEKFSEQIKLNPGWDTGTTLCRTR